MMNHFLIYFSVSMAGTLMTINANSWWMGWLGMEMNLLGFMMLLVNNSSNESTLKYFVVQSLGSVMFISTSMLSENFSLKLFQMLMVTSLLLKLGTAPLHFWLPLMVEKISKFQLNFLLTWQKLAPMYLMFALPLNYMIYLFMMSSLVVGAMSSVNELRLFSIMTYSSMNHTGWILMSLLSNEIISMMYIVIYTAIISTVLMPMSNKNNQSLWNLKNTKKYLLFLNLLSLGGLPPFTGFIIKWIMLSELFLLTNMILTSVLMTTSMMLIYFYLRMSFNSFLNNSMKLSFFKNLNKNDFTLMSMLNLPVMFMMLLYTISMMVVPLTFN